ncbi:hypothetical protein T05_6879 [Trichinella murrelli]|uniref:Secreted protein n=1 Tax=Trichinella murrelli TaxID=144512 RepID=A0A0V0UHA0_9BILA|nr:hypothetical protein T05_6879 [Trichinella murrelli]
MRIVHLAFILYHLVQDLVLVLVQDEKGCKGGVTTNLNVTAVIRRTPHGDDCPVDEHTAYRMEKRAILKIKKAECGRTKDHPVNL